MSKGKLIVIEGVDGSGKATQSAKLYQKLLDLKYNVKAVSFPNYQSPSSSLVKMYLQGDFGQDASQISPTIASIFYAVDRFATYKTELETFYNEGGILIADRYTTANMIHQAGKIDDLYQREVFLTWLEQFEYELLGIPSPDLVFFLNLPVETSLRLMKERENKFTGKQEKDIHEKDINHLEQAHDAITYVAERNNWFKIECLNEQKELRTIDDIHDEILEKIMISLR